MNPFNGIQRAIRATDGGLIMYTIINAPAAAVPQKIEYNLNPGNNLELFITTKGIVDGSISILDEYQNMIGAIGATRIYDANGASIPSTQTVEDGYIQFTVDALKDCVYPLVSITPLNGATTRSTTNFYTYYQGYVERKDYGKTGCISLGLYPKEWGHLSNSEKEFRWTVVVSYIAGTLDWKYWKNESNMKSQWYCHFNWSWFAGDEWNLEPDRTKTPNILNKCNPTSELCP